MSGKEMGTLLPPDLQSAAGGSFDPRHVGRARALARGGSIMPAMYGSAGPTAHYNVGIFCGADNHGERPGQFAQMAATGFAVLRASTPARTQHQHS